MDARGQEGPRGTSGPAQLPPKRHGGTSKEHRTSPVFAPALWMGAHGLPRWPRPLTGHPSDLRPRERPANPPTWGWGAERGEAPTGEGKKPHPSLSLHPGAQGEAGRPARWWGRKVCQLPLWSEVLPCLQLSSPSGDSDLAEASEETMAGSAPPHEPGSQEGSDRL